MRLSRRAWARALNKHEEAIDVQKRLSADLANLVPVMCDQCTELDGKTNRYWWAQQGSNLGPDD